MHKRLLLIVSILLTISGATSCLAMPTSINPNATVLSSSSSTLEPTYTRSPKIIVTKAPTLTPSAIPEPSRTPEPAFTPVPTFTETPTPTEIPYVPEGISVAEGGLMPDQNGENSFKFNPEAKENWANWLEWFYESLWKENHDGEAWIFTYPKSDASEYPNAKAFATAVKEDGPDKTFKMGFPVRNPLTDFDKSKMDNNFINAMRTWQPIGFRLKVDEVNLYNIGIQALDPEQLQQLLGPWRNLDNGALAAGDDLTRVEQGCDVLDFGINETTKQLVITTGSYNMCDNTNGSGFSADELSENIGVIPYIFDNLPNGEVTYPRIGGGKAKTYALNHILVGVIGPNGYDSNSWFLNPPLFTFTK